MSYFWRLVKEWYFGLLLLLELSKIVAKNVVKNTKVLLKLITVKGGKC